MRYSTETLVLEVVWKCGYSMEKAQSVVDSYIDNNKYRELLNCLQKNTHSIPLYEEGLNAYV